MTGGKEIGSSRHGTMRLTPPPRGSAAPGPTGLILELRLFLPLLRSRRPGERNSRPLTRPVTLHRGFPRALQAARRPSPPWVPVGGGAEEGLGTRGGALPGKTAQASSGSRPASRQSPRVHALAAAPHNSRGRARGSALPCPLPLPPLLCRYHRRHLLPPSSSSPPPRLSPIQMLRFPPEYRASRSRKEDSAARN